MDSGAEQLAQLADVQVPVNPSPRANLEVVHPQFGLGHLETPLDRPAGEGDPQQALQTHASGADHQVRQEILHFLRIQDVPRHDQRMRGTGKPALTVLPPESAVLDFPDHRPLLAVLDPKPLPLPLGKDRRKRSQVVHGARLRRLAGHPRIPQSTPGAPQFPRPRRRSRCSRSGRGERTQP